MYSQSLEDSLDDLLVSWEVIEFIPSLKLEERKEIVESRLKKKKMVTPYTSCFRTWQSYPFSCLNFENSHFTTVAIFEYN